MLEPQARFKFLEEIKSLTKMSNTEKDLTHLLRLAITGTSAGPSIYDILSIIGKDEILKRIDLFNQQFKMATITLTKEQLQQIQLDMYYQSHMLTDAEVNALARKVTAAFGIPFLSEEKEFIVFVKIVRWIDTQLYNLLPNEYYELVHDAHNGISQEEANKITERITPLINKVVNIPILPEIAEGLIINMILGIIIHALVRGFNLKE